MSHFELERDITDLKKKIDKYFRRVNDCLHDDYLEDAATNLRRVLELVLNSYVTKYSPEDKGLDMNEKIDALLDKRIIDRSSADALHHIRIMANKGAHVDAAETLTKHKIQTAIAPMKKETQLLYTKLEDSLPRKENHTHSSSSYIYKIADCPNCSKNIALPNGQLKGQVTCTNCNTKYLFLSQNAYNSEIILKRIVTCPDCGLNLSIPIKKRKLAVNCSSCKREFIIEPFSNAQQDTNSATTSSDEPRIIQCQRCSNYITLLNGQLKGRVTCKKCMTDYFVQFPSAHSYIYEIKRIVTCSNCNNYLAIPTKNKRLIVTCSACQNEFIVDPLTNMMQTDADTLTPPKPPKKLSIVILSTLNILLIAAYTAYILWKSNGGKNESVFFNWIVAGHYILLGSVHTWLHPIISKNTILKKIFLLISAVPVNAVLLLISILLSSLIYTSLPSYNIQNFIILGAIIYIISGLVYAISCTYGIKYLKSFLKQKS